MANQIKAKITADATGFTAGLRRAQGALDGASQRWERQFAGLNRGLAAFGGFLAGGLALGALDNFAKAALKMGGAIDDASKTAGIGAAALQEYRFAAQQSGIEIEALDKAIAKFVINLGEARRGNKEYAETFSRIGVVASDTNERALEKTFDFLAGIGDQAQRASVAAELFGARAARMAILVSGGADALAKMRKDARDLGLVLGDDLVSKADEAGDKIDALEAAMRVRLNKTLLENIDGFVTFKELLNDGARFALTLAANIGKAADAIDDFFDRIPGTAISGDASIDNLLSRRGTLQKQIDGFVKQAGAASEVFKKIKGTPLEGLAQKNLDFIEGKLKQKTLELLRLDILIKSKQTAAAAPAPEADAPPPTGVGSGVNLKNPFPGLDAPTLKATAIAKTTEAAGKKIEQFAAKVRTPFETLREELKEIEALKPFAENAEELELLSRAGAAVENQMRQLQVATKLWGVTLDDVARGLSDAFANAIVNGENLLGTLKNLFKQLAARALSNFLFKQIGGALGLPALPGLAGGGPAFAGRSYIVGEQGPEVFTPSVNGSIIPNGDLSGGGVTVNLVNHFDVGLESVDARIGQLTPSISGAVVEAVQRAQARPRYA